MAKTKGRTRRPMPNYQSFYIRIEDFVPDYTFALNSSKYTLGPYWEHLETKLIWRISLARSVAGECRQVGPLGST
jgi:hypothetical protein